MMLVYKGEIYTEGKPWFVANSKAGAVNLLHRAGYKPGRKQNKGLWLLPDGDWARIDEIKSIDSVLIDVLRKEHGAV